MLKRWFHAIVTEAEIGTTTNTETGETEHELRLWLENGRTVNLRLAPGLLHSRNWRV